MTALPALPRVRGMSSSEFSSGFRSLPADHAFVIQLRQAAAPPHDLSGRVEHVVSGRAKRFESLADLLAFVGAVLAELDTEPR